MLEEIHKESDVNSPLMEVTSLSKYLAMTLFIAMPFIGGWIGYVYSPEKIVEVDRAVYTTTESPTATDNGPSITENTEGPWLLYFNPQGGYSIDYPSRWLFETEETNVVFKERMLTDEQNGFLYETAGEEVMRVSIEKREPEETVEEWYTKKTAGTGVFQKIESPEVWRDQIKYTEVLGDETWVTYAKVARGNEILLLSLNESLKDTDPGLPIELLRNLKTPPGDIAAYIKKVFMVGNITFITYDNVLFRSSTPTCFGVDGYCIENESTVAITVPVRGDTKLFAWSACTEDSPQTDVDALGVPSRCVLPLTRRSDNEWIPYWLKFDDEGYVTKIVEQYIP